MVNLSLLDFLQRRNAVFHTVQSQIAEPGRVHGHGFQDAAGGGEEAGAAVFVRLLLPLNFNAFFFQPAGQLLVGQHRVHHALVVLGLILLGHAGTDEDGLCVGNAALDMAHLPSIIVTPRIMVNAAMLK